MVQTNASNSVNKQATNRSLSDIITNKMDNAMELKYGRKYTHQVRDHICDHKIKFDLFKSCFMKIQMSKYKTITTD